LNNLNISYDLKNTRQIKYVGVTARIIDFAYSQMTKGLGNSICWNKV